MSAAPRRSMLHDFRLGELVRLEKPAGPFGPRAVLQIVGFRGDTMLKVIPPGGIPVPVPFGDVERTGVAGSSKPPRPPHRRRPRKPRAKKPPTATPA